MSSSIPATLVVTTLDMTHRAQFRPAFLEALPAGMHIERWKALDVDFYLTLYKGVGWELRWRDRLIMPREQLERALEQAQVYVLYAAGAAAGYVELEAQGPDVEIAYFGLFAAYQGLGLGKHLLSYGIEQAWRIPGAQRIWVHTCNLDGPHALPNYLKRGFRVYNETHEPMPERYKT